MNGDYAVAYAQVGWKVLPTWWVNEDGTCGCGGTHAEKPKDIGKHPLGACVPRGFLDASSNLGVVQAWWAAYPEANIAVACEASGLLVVDVDPRNGGAETFKDYETELPFTKRSHTGGGGDHYFYTLPAGTLRGKLGPGIDIKPPGYVLLPPSNHVSGTYEWATQGVPIVSLGEAASLVLRSSQRTAVLKEGSGEYTSIASRALEGVNAGDRHDAFKEAAARYRAKNLTYAEALGFFERAYELADQSQHVFPWDEAIALLDWAWTLPPGTTADQELEAYEGYINHIRGNGLPEIQGADLAEKMKSVPEALYERVMEEFKRQEVRDIVKRIRVLEAFRAPESYRLDDLQRLDLPDCVWRVEQLHELGSNTSITAPAKTGKTTFVFNLAQSLADATPFLDNFEVNEPVRGGIAFFNYEMDIRVTRRWLKRMEVRHPHVMHIMQMRGEVLDLQDDYASEWLVKWLREREIECWIIDPYARAKGPSLGENEADDAERWFQRADVIKKEAGVQDLFVTFHTGHVEAGAEAVRARGSSRILGWPDNIWTITEDIAHNRFFTLERTRSDAELFDGALLHFNQEYTHLSLNEHRLTRRDVAVQEDFNRGVNEVVAVAHMLGATREKPVRPTKIRDACPSPGSPKTKTKWIENAIMVGRLKRAYDPQHSNWEWVWVEEDEYGAEGNGSGSADDSGGPVPV